jgi:hypothetical protein
MVRRGDPHLVVSLANDAWFGDSQEPRLAHRLARLRAIETRRAVVRATNSGISSAIDPLGRVAASTALGAEATLRAEVPLLTLPTPYVRLGDWPGPLGARKILPRPCERLHSGCAARRRSSGSRRKARWTARPRSSKRS